MSTPCFYVNFNLNPVYETPVVWLPDGVPVGRHMAMYDRAEE